MKQFRKALPILVAGLDQRPVELIYTEIPFPSVAVPTSCHEIVRIYRITTAGDGFDVVESRRPRDKRRVCRVRFPVLV